MELFTSEPRPRGRPAGTPRALIRDERTGVAVSAPGEWQPQAMKPVHETIADLVISSPGLTAGEIGAKVGRHPVTVRLVMKSDLFRELLAQKRAQFVDPKVEAKIEELFDVAIAGSVEVLAKRVEESQDFDLAERTLKAIGPMSKYGARTPPPAVQANFIVPMPQKSASSDAWEARAREVIENGRTEGAAPQPDR